MRHEADFLFKRTYHQLPALEDQPVFLVNGTIGHGGRLACRADELLRVVAGTGLLALVSSSEVGLLALDNGRENSVNE